MNDPAIRRILAVFFVVCAVLAFVAIVAVRNIGRATAASDWVNHTHAVLQEAGQILSTARAGEGTLRAYAAGGDEADAEASRAAFGEMLERLEVAKALTRADPAQHARVLEIERLANGRAALADAVFAARRAGQPGEIQTLLDRADWRSTGEIHRAVEQLQAEQMALLADRDRTAFLQAQTTRWTVWAGVAFNVLLLAGAVWLIRDDLAARRRVAAVLEQANAELETRVRERTAELATANEQLANENLERRWANEALEHQVHYHQLIVNSIGDGVFVLTKALNISRINPAVVHLTGFEAQHLVNRPLASVLRRVDDKADGVAPMFDPLLQALREGRDLRDIPGEAENKLGQKKPVRFALYPLRDRDKVVGGVAVVQPRGLQPVGVS